MNRSFPTLFRPSRVVFLIKGLLAFLLSGCASTGATWRSGVGDSFPTKPPYYAGRGASTGPDGSLRIGHVPVSFQRGATWAPMFDPTLGGSLEALLDEMNAYLDSMAVSKRLVDGGRVSAMSHHATWQPPDVHFGCSGIVGGLEECDVQGDAVLGREHHRMHLAVGRPSEAWVAWMEEVMVAQQADAALVITLEVGQYLVRQRGLRGHKELELGTGHVVSLPFLTSLETPVAVLQLTGALVGRDGKVLRIGAEGLLPHRTGMRVVALGGQEVITDEDVHALRHARREDLRGVPSTWKVGLRTLVDQLLQGHGGER